MQRTDVKPRAEVLAEMAAWLEREHGIKMLGGLGFENAYALAMPRSTREALGIRTLADLARPRAEPVDRRRLRVLRPAGMGSDPQDLRPRRSASSGRCSRSSCTPAAASGEVDVIAGYTSDGRIAQFDLVVLDDPKHAIPPYDAVLLISPQRANDAALLAALRPLVDAIDVTMMREANLRASGGDSASPARRRAGCRSEIETRTPLAPRKRQRVDAEIIARRSVHTAIGVQPAPRASAPNDSTEYL